MTDPAGGSIPMVLVVDDDPAVRTVLAALLTQDGMAAHGVDSAAAALRFVAQHPVDVVLTDLRMPDMDGLALLREMRRDYADIPVVMLTAHGTVSTAVEAMRAGAVDFLLKPFDRDNVRYTLEKACALSTGVSNRVQANLPSDSGLVGESAPMRKLADLIERAAKVPVTTLITGETGTGKELVAHAIHAASSRASKPFVAVSCAALPESLLESELFGHEKGAFTGAIAARPGRFELADGGTLFLDEIGEVPLPVQPKLLRALQERETQRIGASAPRRVDVRIVAATHRNLEEMVEAGTFREDLYYRLNVLPVQMPPLRARPSDIGVLARHFSRVLSREHQRPQPVLDESAIAVLAQYEWPGNVRELQNVIERLVVMGDVTRPAAPQLGEFLKRSWVPDAGHAVVTRSPDREPERLADTLRDAERTAIADALKSANNNRSLAARLLGISRRNLYLKLAQHDLSLAVVHLAGEAHRRNSRR